MVSTWILHCTETCSCSALTFLPAPLPPLLFSPRAGKRMLGTVGTVRPRCRLVLPREGSLATQAAPFSALKGHK